MTLSPHRRGLGGRWRPPRAAFTLVEMMVVTALISLMAAAVLFAMFGVLDDAKESRTRAQIAKLNELLLTHWESYRTRPVPIRTLPSTLGIQYQSPREYVAKMRLLAIRELMRLELPERKTDVIDWPVVLQRPETDASGNVTGWTPIPPTLWRTYRRRARAMAGPAWENDWSHDHQGAECLYLIVAAMRQGDARGLDFFRPNEIGDTDGDHMPEILDGWGRPIEFLRWAPGYRVDMPAGSSTMQIADAAKAPDPFDPLRVDPHWQDPTPIKRPFALYPLVFSAGRDQLYEIATDDSTTAIRYAQTKDPVAPSLPWPNDPYFLLPPPPENIAMGTAVDVDGDGTPGYVDNITNHFLEVR